MYKITLTQKFTSLLIIAALLAGVFAAFQQAPAQAALCAATHIVKKGETLKTIARIYKVNYKVLAKENNLNVNEKLVPGEKLCIPKGGRGEPNMNLVISAAAGKLNIAVSNQLREDKYLVKVREGDSGPWYALGRFGSGVKGTVKNLTYTLPDKLKSKMYLTVCLKNMNTDALTCRAVFNPG